jgi:serine/threonine-protein kinase
MPVGLSLLGGQSPGESEASREFLKARVAFFSKVTLLVLVGSYLCSNLIAYLGPHPSPSRGLDQPWNLSLLAASLVQLLAGWVASRKRASSSLLQGAEAGAVVLVCALLPLGGWLEGDPRLQLPALLAVTNVLLARAVIIPSHALRTFTVSAVASIPWIVIHHTFLARRAYAGASPLIDSLLLLPWSLTTVVVSTVASRVIFGLQREMKLARRLGQYTLEEKIGAGGMGEVYRARHALLRRPTAIKLLRRERAGDRSLARFEREVQLTSRLTHPNTIAIYDYGRTLDGTFYYAMEYLPGLTLEALVKNEGAQCPGRVIHVLLQVCRSLREAHGIGLIHRDIKAANVILCERGGMYDVVKVVDFGLVKDLEHLSDSVSSLNVITGTPHYLSPEAICAPLRMDCRSDLYSLGVLGYYLLTGEKVFQGTTFMEICGHHLTTAPQPPSARVPFPMPSDLERLILQCLEKDPGRRPRDAATLLRALERCHNAHDWGEEEAQAWWKAHGEQKAWKADSSPLECIPLQESSTILKQASSLEGEHPSV